MPVNKPSEFAPRCCRCGRVLTDCIVSMSMTDIQVLGDCSRCGSAVTASQDSWDVSDFHLDLRGNVMGQMELPLGV